MGSAGVLDQSWLFLLSAVTDCFLQRGYAWYMGTHLWAWVFYFGIFMEVVREKKRCFFFGSMASCAVIEYSTACILEKVFYAKWWDYSEAFLNFGGKICFVSVVGFGIAGGLAVLFIMPHYQKLTGVLPIKYQKAVCCVLSLLFTADLVCSVFTPNMGLGVFAIR